MPLPLLRLPKKLTVDVLRTFGIPELLAISILSKRAKKTVKLLNIRPLNVDVYISNSIEIELIFNEPTSNLVLEFYKNRKRRNTVLNIPKKVTLPSDGNQIIEWRIPSSNMTMKDWYMHIQSILDIGYPVFEGFSLYFQLGCAVFNFESIKQTFTCIELSNLSISEKIPNNQSGIILKEFLTKSNGLILNRNPFWNGQDLRKILIQNLEVIDYGTDEDGSDFTLNDMLMCNIAFLHITLPTWTDREINRFLKLWRKGACPKLCELVFYYDPEDWRWNREEVLRGINFQEFTRDREIRCSDGDHMHVTDGYDFRGINGRICTIEVRELDCYRFYFYD